MKIKLVREGTRWENVAQHPGEERMQRQIVNSYLLNGTTLINSTGHVIELENFFQVFAQRENHFNVNICKHQCGADLLKHVIDNLRRHGE